MATTDVVLESYEQIRSETGSWFCLPQREYHIGPNAWPNVERTPDGVRHTRVAWHGPSELVDVALYVLQAFHRIAGGHGKVMKAIRPGVDAWHELVTDANPAHLRQAIRSNDVLQDWLRQWVDDWKLCSLTRPDLVVALKEELDRAGHVSNRRRPDLRLVLKSG